MQEVLGRRFILINTVLNLMSGLIERRKLIVGGPWRRNTWNPFKWLIAQLSIVTYDDSFILRLRENFEWACCLVKVLATVEICRSNLNGIQWRILLLRLGLLLLLLLGFFDFNWLFVVDIVDLVKSRSHDLLFVGNVVLEDIPALFIRFHLLKKL